VTLEPALGFHVVRDLEVLEHFDGDQSWLVSWHPPEVAPAGTGHGSSAVCITREGLVLLVRERETENWQLPGGRPEGDEDWRATLDREVREEACAVVLAATALGFSRSECVDGRQRGTVLVRAFWRADIALEEWAPQFEMLERRAFTPDDALTASVWNRALAPIYRRVFVEALRRAGEPPPSP
jgi:ADP-ribose pyrophosphatase YjhB (NUDIX family)